MKSLLKTVVAALVVTASVAQAEQVVSKASTNVTILREAQLTVLANTQKQLAARIDGAMVQVQALSEAKKLQGAYEINIEESNTTKNAGWIFMVAGLVGSYGLKSIPLSELAKNLTKPTWVMAGAGGVALIGGWAYKGFNQIQLRTSEAKYVEAVESLKILNEQLKNDREVVLSQASTLGVKVENKILSFDGLNLPEGLKQIGGGVLGISGN